MENCKKIKEKVNGLEQSKPCDIIIPVYNAPSELQECVDSLMNHTNLDDNRIIIINDCSPDPGVEEYLLTLNETNGIIILHNQQNLGFVGTVNRGMSYSVNDVVLLNSDTIVTKDWLEQMKKVAYLDESIATVTPLTNNGSICSVPNFLADNSIPEGYTVDTFAHFINHTSLKLFPEIPTAVGFCMYIKRKVIDEVGFFDQETFGKGYAEENDFCCRVIEHGYKNVLDDHTFIFHKGSMSFQGEKQALLIKNLKTLNDRYPYYEKNVHDFIVKNPLKPIQDNIKLRLPHFEDYQNIKGNILFVLHNFFDESYNHPIGGTEYHVKDIVSELKDYYAYVLVSGGDELVLKQYYNGDFIAKYHFPLQDPIAIQHFHHQEYSNVIERILGSFEISLIHVHHLIKHSFDIPYIAKKYNIKVLFTLHDYYLFCPRVNLLDENNKYCIDDRSETKCNQCLRSSHGFHTTFINKWKQQVNEMIPLVDQFITPSDFTKRLFEFEFPSLKDRIITIEHGVTVNKALEENSINEQKDKWNIGFLGGLSANKGSGLIYQLVTKYPKDKVNWHLIGGLGDQRLNLLDQKNVFKHGKYSREQLGDILKKLNIDFICLLSPWPETFSYTLSEAWLYDIPVLVTPMGALEERVKKVGGGWVSKSTDLKDIIYEIDLLIQNGSSQIDNIKENIKKYNFNSKLDMVEQYVRLYDSSIIPLEKITGRTCFENEYIITALKYYLPTSENVSLEDYNNQIRSLEDEINAMKSTIGWKVLNKLRSNNSWVLKVGKRLIFFLLKLKGR